MHTSALLTVAALTKVVEMRERNATGASFDRNFMEKRGTVGEIMSVTRMSSRSRVNGIIVVERRRWSVGMKERDGEGRSKRWCLWLALGAWRGVARSAQLMSRV